MGKDQELLDAARNGNVSVVEKILSQKARRSGPLASLRRGPGANVQDNSGYTPLHHSALNGHKDIVQLLLGHDASPNVTDHKGSSPLHLAAWTGNTEIVKLLLVQSNVQPNVNLTNSDGDTPLHCAAQYGHVDVVNLLLQHNCDPTICNTKEETALDLAAQYGRLETVETLVKTHPELLAGSHTKHHSALHLASRNGHKPVVQVLLNSGFPVDTLTETGSALHEAATFGKVEVVRVLLENGVDLEAEDSRRRSVMDILEELKTFKSQEIASVIQNHSTLITTAECDLQNANPPPSRFASSPYENITLPKWASADGGLSPPGSAPVCNSAPVYQIPPRTPRSVSVDLERRPYGSDVYQVPPTPEPLESSFEGSDMSVTSSIYQTPPPPRELDAMSIGSSYYETPPTPREIGKSPVPPQRSSLPEDQTLLYQIPPPPREVLKRLSDPSHSVSGGPLKTSDHQNSDLFHRQLSCGAGYIPMGPVQVGSKFLRPPLKPPRKNVSPHSPTKYHVQSGPPGVAYEYLYLASTGGISYDEDEKDHCETDVPATRWLHGTKLPGEYVDMKMRHSFVPCYENEIPYFRTRKCGREGSEDEDQRTDRLSGSEIAVATVYENVPRLMGRKSPANHKVVLHGASRPGINCDPSDGDKVSKPNCLELQVKRRGGWDMEQSNGTCGAPPTDDGFPLSPSGYQQPPTPDFPPPSPGTAETGIHEKMRPLSKEYKRRSRDNETVTEDEVFQLIQHEHGAMTLQVVTREHKSVSTENIEEIKGDVPFAGLHRGSKIQSSSSDDTCDESNYYTPCSLSSPSDWSDQQQIRSQGGPSRQRFRKQANVYENVNVEMDPHTGHRHLSVQSSNGSQYENVDLNSVLSPFDENAEWAKISDIMATFSGGLPRARNLHRNSNDGGDFSVQLSHPGNRRSVASRDVIYQLSAVGKWLSRLGVGQYENLFLTNGFDDLDFMGGDMIEESDLIEMRITNADHRRIILGATHALPAVKAIVDTASPNRPKNGLQFDTVDDWLRSIHLEFYSDIFHRHKYGDMERVMKMWEVELTTILEITRPGHKKRILLSLGERPIGPRIYDDVNELNCDLTNLKHEINQLDQMGKPKPEANPNGTLRRRNGSHKPPAPPPPPRRSSSKSPCDPNGNKDGFPVSDSSGAINGIESIIIRDPSQLFTGIPTSLTTQWRHKLDDFVSGCCKYTAKYLGSTLIKELKGVESSKKSIQKLKKSTVDIGKIPTVVLSISYKGVKFIDATTKNEVCEHEICNINCACQDADDLNHFAYVTKDHLTGNHYCHVFSVATMEMATEIILTLGQAFEVAYQIALRDKNLQSSNGHAKKPPPQSLGSQHHHHQQQQPQQPPLFSPKALEQNYRQVPVVSGERQ